MLIPALKTIIDKSSENGVDQVIMGMPHRYRRRRLSPLAPRPAVPSRPRPQVAQAGVLAWCCILQKLKPEPLGVTAEATDLREGCGCQRP